MTLYLFIGLSVAIILAVAISCFVQPEDESNAPDINNLRRGIHSQRHQP